MTSRSVIASFKPWAARTPRHIRDVTRPFRIYFRRNRMREFLRWMAVSDCMTIIDVGGTPFVWQLTNCDPSVTIVGPSMTNLWVWGTRGDLDIGARYNVVTGLTDVDDISSLAPWRQSAHALICQPRCGLPAERLWTKIDLMHLTHSILYLIIGFLAGIITGAALMAAWVIGWLLPVPPVDPRIGLDKK